MRRLDAQHAYPEEFVDALTRAGWLAALIPAEYGGSGLGLTEASVILEEITRAGANAGACATFLYNLRLAVEDIQSGRRRVAVVGNAEAPLIPYAIAAQRIGCFERYVDEVHRHMWAVPKKMDDPAVIRAALLDSGLPADVLLAGTTDPEVKQGLVNPGDVKRRDDQFAFVAGWEYAGAADKAPILNKEPLSLEYLHLAQRNYK